MKFWSLTFLVLAILFIGAGIISIPFKMPVTAIAFGVIGILFAIKSVLFVDEGL